MTRWWGPGTKNEERFDSLVGPWDKERFIKNKVVIDSLVGSWNKEQIDSLVGLKNVVTRNKCFRVENT